MLKEGKEKLVADRWGMMEWLVEYIHKNQKKWEKEKAEKERILRKNKLEWEKQKGLRR